MTKVALLIIVASLSNLSFAQDLAVSQIPEELMESADAVIRFDKTEFLIESTKESNTKRHWAITIMNARGAEEHELFRAYYDDFSKVRKIEGILYDAQGKEIKNLRGKDVEDYALSGFSEGVSDGRVKVADFSNLNIDYPYTIEFSYEKQDKNMLFFPSWVPITAEKTAIMSSEFSIESKEVPFRVKENGMTGFDVVKKTAHPFIKSWSLENVKPFKYEGYSQNEDVPHLVTAPSLFEIDGYKGEMNSWSDIGKFYAELNSKRDELPEEQIAKLKQLIKPEMSFEEKVKTTYEFMQSHTRYMSIQLGIGGWQTMTAKSVAERGYGDCKALTNYTIALLKTIDIKAYPVIISAGKNFSNPLEDFPNMSFNHVIACVPSVKDTIWLECTSQTNPAGFLGSFTGNRKGLLVKSEGAELVNTIQYSPQENFQKRTAEVWLKEDGNAKLKIASSYGGIQQSRRADVVDSYNHDEQIKFLKGSIDLASFELGDFKLEKIKNKIPEVTEDVSLTARKLVAVSGKRLFLKPNILSGFYGTPLNKEDRKTNLYLNPNIYTVEDSDVILFHIPEGYKTEKSPKPILLESPFGVYASEVKREGNTLNYTRKVSVKGGTYDKSMYSEWVDFLKAINRADKQRVVFLNGDT
ncbi:DUF3857 domain-containing protein [Arcticibacterium luteifluviistationis]|uniref:DUF3857 domain-containing protein n=1 Tax=Arcticibacterium luteifluviistationis TaxID=1784714 RepID=A0A2Z4GAF6_9BACT|nr:DUF3857 domain-containing protein [Arcticibacterium luteifluviistationis]AWV98065.1 hypothetical protein DJ013_07720 [Arcticibacterium luteifluviistationis]